MPAKKQIPKEVILQAATELLEKSGAEALNARALAKHLGCSTQPIYLSFAGMEELRYALLERCKQIQESYIEQEAEGTLFLRCSLGFLRFVYEKPQLFRFLYFENTFQNSPADRAFIEATVHGIMQAGGYTRAIAERFYYSAWFFMYGIAVQLVYGFASPNWEEIRTLLNDQFWALTHYYKEPEHEHKG